MGLFKPKWKSKNLQKRLKAVEDLFDESILEEIAKTDPVENIRAIATQKITNQTVLEIIAKTDESHIVREKAVKKVKDLFLLKEIAINDTHSDVCKRAIDNISNEHDLKEVYKKSKNNTAANYLLKKIKDEKILTDLVLETKSDIALKKIKDIENILFIFERVSDQKLKNRCNEKIENHIKSIKNKKELEDIALNHHSWLLREAAISNLWNDLRKIENEQLIEDIIRNSKRNTYIAAAIELLEDIDKLIEIQKDADNFYKEELLKKRIDYLKEQNTIKSSNTKELIEIVKSTKPKNYRREALNHLWENFSEISNIKDDQFLIEVYKLFGAIDSKKFSIERIENQDFLEKIAKTEKMDCYKSIRLKAISKIKSEEVLLQIALGKSEPDDICKHIVSLLKDEKAIEKVNESLKQKAIQREKEAEEIRLRKKAEQEAKEKKMYSDRSKYPYLCPCCNKGLTQAIIDKMPHPDSEAFPGYEPARCPHCFHALSWDEF